MDWTFRRRPGTALELCTLIVLISYGTRQSFGLLWLATVPPTAGPVSSFFGPRYMATLYGIACLSHQVGGFPSVWMAGRIRDLSGTCETWWRVIIAAGGFAALLHWPIRETPVERLAREPAS